MQGYNIGCLEDFVHIIVIGCAQLCFLFWSHTDGIIINDIGIECLHALDDLTPHRTGAYNADCSAIQRAAAMPIGPCVPFTFFCKRIQNLKSAAYCQHQKHRQLCHRVLVRTSAHGNRDSFFGCIINRHIIQSNTCALNKLQIGSFVYHICRTLKIGNEQSFRFFNRPLFSNNWIQETNIHVLWSHVQKHFFHIVVKLISIQYNVIIHWVHLKCLG